MAKAESKQNNPAVIPKPKNDTELDRLIAELGNVVRKITVAQADYAGLVDPITKRYKKILDPLKNREEALTDAISEYAQKNRDRLTESGKSKTVTLTSGTIKWYLASKWRTILPENFDVRKFRSWLIHHGFALEKVRAFFQHHEPTLKKDVAVKYREELDRHGSVLKFEQPEYFQIIPEGLDDLKNPPLDDLKRDLGPVEK